MSDLDFSLTAVSRSEQGKGASRRLRRTGMVPAIVYGGEKAPATISVEHRVLVKHLENEAFYSHILTLTTDGINESVVLKDLQRHPAKPFILHADFMRVNMDEKIRMHIPLHFIGEDIAPGVKIGSGLVTHNITEVEVSCLPKDLPEFITVDISKLELDHSLHLSDLQVPAGVELVELSHGEDHDQPVVAIHKPRGAIEAGSDTDTTEETE
ncbi:MAG: 50S ribosomal protein L25/general stress protein Ctc [Gammaproteobacteria bacterium]|nr:50S ribosomal protein L25/general stress protein Ctc [Gammaproteobacteria bacterium]